MLSMGLAMISLYFVCVYVKFLSWFQSASAPLCICSLFQEGSYHREITFTKSLLTFYNHYHLALILICPHFQQLQHEELV